MNYKEVTI